MNAYALEIVAEEVPPDRVPKKRKRRGSVAADITVRDFGPGAKLFGRYTLSRILGRGGMGIVWLARDEELDRQVALKFLSQQIIHDHALLDDLKRETKRSLELTHPNIVRIHDFFQDARSACISMEFVDGETLSNLRVSKRNQIFEVPDLEPLVAQWCEAMHYAHVHARVVHCDLKPANLMLNAKGLLKITDFGIARSLSESASKLTATRSTSGTLVYMSPQQLNGDPASVSDDIYSMGATLYELLTGKPPFYRGQIDLQIFDKIPPSITDRRTELGVTSPFIVPLEWEETIAACLSKEPGERPRGALPLLDRLKLVSPLRKETPITPIDVKELQDVPLSADAFGLMQEQPGGILPRIPLRERAFMPLSESPPDIPDKPPPVESVDPVSLNQGAPQVRQTMVSRNRRFVDRVLEAFYLGSRPNLVLISMGLMAIVVLGFWYVLESRLDSEKPATPSNSPSISPGFTPIPAGPSSVVQQPKIPDVTPRPSLALTPNSPSITSSTVAPQVPAKTPEPVPKDDATRVRNEVAAAERSLLAPHEKKTIQQRLQTMPVNAQGSYQKAIFALREGYPNTAWSYALDFHRTAADEALSICLQGLIRVLLGELDKAETALAQAATSDPDFLEVQYNLGSVAFKKKDYTRARKRFEHLLSVVSSPSDRLTQFLQYRIYLGFLLEGAPDSAQQLLQRMQANEVTPAFYYAHAAWEFRRNDSAIAKQWVDGARSQFGPDLNTLFADPLSDVGWLGSSADSPGPASSPTVTPTSTATSGSLSLAEIKLSQVGDTNASVHLELKIGVLPGPNTPNGHTIDIRVSFFDIAKNGRIVATDAHTNYRWMTPNRNWAERTAKYLVATYVRPKSRTATTDRKFGGYIVRIYFDGHLQDEKAVPAALLKVFPTDRQAMLVAPDVAPSASPQDSVQSSATPAPAASASPASAESETISEISTLEDKWAIAVLLHDAEAIQSLLADAYEAVTPTGRKLNKSQAVQRISDDTDKYDLVEVENINVQAQSTTSAVATGLLRQRGKFSSGKVFERAYLFTDDWSKSEGKWLCTRSRTERSPKH